MKFKPRVLWRWELTPKNKKKCRWISIWWMLRNEFFWDFAAYFEKGICKQLMLLKYKTIPRNKLLIYFLWYKSKMSYLKASAPKICSRGIHPSTLIKSNQCPIISKQISMSHRLPKKIHVIKTIDKIYKNLVLWESKNPIKSKNRTIVLWFYENLIRKKTNQTSSWWKPSSHKKPLGKKDRLGTAV